MQDSRHDEEGHIKNFSGTEAIKKLKELAEDARTCMLTTFTAQKPMPSRPMALQEVDEQGSLWFMSAASSNKNKELAVDPSIQLFFGNSSANEYLSIYGTATVSQDKAKIKELWNPYVKVWFQEGPDDPDLTLIEVKPDSCSYWDTKHNKMVAWAKMAASMVTGKTMDDGVEGKLSV